MLVEIGGFSASSLHLRRPHFRFPRNEVIQDDCWKWRGRHFPPPPQLGSKSYPQVLVDVISGPPSWNQDGGATSNVWRTSKLPWNPQKGVVLVQKHPVDLWSYFFLLFEKHLMVSLSSHSWNGWGSCPLATTGKSISLHMSTPRSMKCGVDFGKHLLYFFLDFMFFFFLTVLYNSHDLL